MAHRTIVDDDGVAWEVWDVHPRWAERRVAERRGAGASPHGLERRQGERRTIEEKRPSVSPDLCRGWLTFESAVERRRLAPVPKGWEELAERDLVAMLQRGRTVPQARKRLIE